MDGARLWLVRHGETDWNAAGRVQGHTPTELNERGRGQAREIGRRLKGRVFAGVWSSDLPRAYQTAQLLVESASFSLEIERSERLRERSFGKYEGMTTPEIGAARTALGLNATGDLADWTGMPGVESNDVLWERVSGELGRISEGHAGEDVMVVTHGGVIARVVYRVMGIPEGVPRRFPLSNGMVAVVQWRGDAWDLLTVMDLGLALGEGGVGRDTSRGG
ncbi:MAG: histidine phosphatase family protein [Phycisphaerae bacterium]